MLYEESGKKENFVGSLVHQINAVNMNRKSFYTLMPAIAEQIENYM